MKILTLTQVSFLVMGHKCSLCSAHKATIGDFTLKFLSATFVYALKFVHRLLTFLGDVSVMLQK